MKIPIRKIRMLGKRDSTTFVICGLILLLVIAIKKCYDCHVKHQDERMDSPTSKTNVKFIRISDANVESEQRWYNLSNGGFRIFAFSAIYDDRPSLLSSPVIRVIAISDPVEGTPGNESQQFYCILHHETKDVVLPLEAELKSTSLGWPWRSRAKPTLREYIFTCPTIKLMIPQSVSIVTDPSEYFPSGVPVTVPRKPTVKQDFAVCVQVAYGTVNPYRLIEWTEVLRILGVNLIGVTVLHVNKEALNVWQHYADEGFVDLQYSEYIYPSDNETGHFNLQKTPVINDCMYRHMYEFKKIIVIDFDEFIMPQKHKNLSEMIKYLDRQQVETNSPEANFVFQNVYFLLDFPPDESISPYLSILSHRDKTEVSPVGDYAKSIINPMACSHMHNHYCWGLTAKYSRLIKINKHYKFSKNVDPQIGLNHHYKKCNYHENYCKKIQLNKTRGDIMLQYKELLTERVRAKVKLTMGHDI